MELQFDSPLFLVNTVTGSLMLIIALIAHQWPPKYINRIYGYRTPRSGKNQRNWDFAQQYSNFLMIRYSLVYIALGLFGLMSHLSDDLELGIAIGSLILIMITIVVKTEYALKNFENEKYN